MFNHLLKGNLKELYLPKKKEIDQAHNTQPDCNWTHQLDILYLPTTDDGYKYLLLIIDCYNNLAEARPLKVQYMSEIIKQINDIYKKSKLLKKPRLIMSDNQFNNTIYKKWCEKNNINYQFAYPLRHSQLSHINRLCQTIGTALIKLMEQRELDTNKTFTNWTEWMKLVLDIYNNKYQGMKPKETTEDIVINKNNNELLLPKQKVRLYIHPDHPINIWNGRLQGKRRGSDIKYENHIYEIVAPVLIPNSVPLYKIKDERGNIPDFLVHREELQIIK